MEVRGGLCLHNCNNYSYAKLRTSLRPTRNYPPGERILHVRSAEIPILSAVRHRSGAHVWRLDMEGIGGMENAASKGLDVWGEGSMIAMASRECEAWPWERRSRSNGIIASDAVQGHRLFDVEFRRAVSIYAMEYTVWNLRCRSFITFFDSWSNPPSHWKVRYLIINDSEGTWKWMHLKVIILTNIWTRLPTIHRHR